MPFLGCRMVLFTLEHGVCQDSVFGFVQYASILCQQCKLIPGIQEACRVGKAAMELMKRFGSSAELMPKVTFCYYGFVATHTEPLQVCSKNLRSGFLTGISAGCSASPAFYNSIHLIRCALLSGESLPALLKEADYHLEIMTRFRNKISEPYVSSYR